MLQLTERIILLHRTKHQLFFRHTFPPKNKIRKIFVAKKFSISYKRKEKTYIHFGLRKYKTDNLYYKEKRK